MATGAARRTRSRRIAQVLWIVWAVLVWNVVFDQVIVRAARDYLAAAMTAVATGGPYARMDAWMRPAVAHGALLATLASGAILLVGFAGLRVAGLVDRAGGAS
jgi:hypothetical protein